ncbi:hypothetical protein Tco_0960468 [Tanacetum coccineum]
MMEDFMKRMNQQREHEALLVAQREQELREQKQAALEEEELSPNFVCRQLIEETCGAKVCEEQKQNMEDTMLDLLEICQQKELYCIHNNVDNLMESALNSKLLSINLNSQHLNKEEQEVKNIVEQVPKHRTRTSILTLFERTKSRRSVENLVPIPSESEVTSDNESECDVPVNDESSQISTTFSNPLFDSNDDFTFSNDESLSNEDVLMENFKIYSNPLFDNEEIISTKIDPHYFNAESNLIESLLIEIL